MSQIKILGWIHVILNGGLLALGLFIVAGIGMMDDKDNMAAPMVVWAFLNLAVFLFIPGLIGGIGLLSLKWWARVLIIILSLMHVVLFPIGTLLGGFGLWVLLSREAQVAFGDRTVAGQMERAVQELSHPSEGTAGTINLLLVMAGVGAGFIVVLGAGFMISGDPGPVELMSLFYPALGVLLVVLAFGVRRLLPR